MISEVLLALVEVGEKVSVGLLDFFRAGPDFSRAGADDHSFWREDGQHAFKIVAGHGVIVRLEHGPDLFQFGVFGLLLLGFGCGGEAGNGGDCCESGDDRISTVHTV